MANDLVNIEKRDPSQAQLVGASSDDHRIRTSSDAKLIQVGNSIKGATFNYRVFDQQSDQFVRLADHFQKIGIKERPPEKANYSAEFDGRRFSGEFTNDLGQQGRFEYWRTFSEALLGKEAPPTEADVQAGFRAIDRALDHAKRTADTVRLAQFALSNIWVAGLLERSATLRGHLFDALNGVAPASVERMTRLADGVAAIYRALEEASRSGRDGLATGQPFLNAAREALCPEHLYPTVDLTIDLHESRFTDFLRRHQLNAWLHSLQTSSWSWLFLASASARGPLPDVPGPSLDIFKTLAPLSDRDSRIGYGFRQTELLYRAAGGEQLAASDALHVAAMLRAAGSFEYLGDHLLLAWRTAGTVDERRAIAWFLRERVPNVGFNALPKMALDQFQRTAAGAS